MLSPYNCPINLENFVFNPLKKFYQIQVKINGEKIQKPSYIINDSINKNHTIFYGAIIKYDNFNQTYFDKDHNISKK